jgi:hypothetical protein
MAVAITDPERKALLRRGFALKYATLAWNMPGIVILAIAAVSAWSVALAMTGTPTIRRIRAPGSQSRGRAPILLTRWQIKERLGCGQRPQAAGLGMGGR